MILYGEPIGGFTKLTANQLAKFVVYEKGSNAEYWREDDLIPTEKFTEKEIQQVEKAVQKHIDRLWDFLGVEKIYDKVIKK